MWHKRNLVTGMLAGLFLIQACSKDDPINGNDAVTAKTLFNVAYGADPLQKMDVYLPANRSTSTTPVIVMIHGGSWTSGDKLDFNAFVDTMKRRLPAYAVVNLNYRLASGINNLFPTQELDVKAAVEEVYNKRNEYLLSDKFVLIGASAGGHLALLQGLKYASPVKPRAIVDFFGPADMRAMYLNPTIPGGEVPILAVMGSTPSQDSLLYARSSPINFIDSNDPPTIILHGGQDILVRPSQSDSLYSRLQAAGVRSRYIFYPNENHGWTGANLFDSFNQIQAFLEENVP